MDPRSLTILEIVLLLLVCAFIFSTSLINLLTLEPDENDSSQTSLVVLSFITIIVLSGIPMLFLLYEGVRQISQSISSYRHGAERGPFAQIMGFESAGWAIVFMIMVTLLLVYSAMTVKYLQDRSKKDVQSECTMSHQYLFVNATIMLSFSAFVLVIMIITGTVHLVHYYQKPDRIKSLDSARLISILNK
jgi:O-antigen/teichoic acid export membrane protein